MTGRRALLLVLIVILVVAGSTVFFRHVEGWTWLESYFFTVVTLSTVGYGNLIPATALGKIATTVLIFFGIAVVVVAIQQLGQFAIIRKAETRRTLRRAEAERQKRHDRQQARQKPADEDDR
ncbi:potassium channel family protein [Histidinibacterium lentulum]|uniref:Two pore domain potassium channel family protein n=1 Tax=Histidinibacterium lentulum TaxID=2480588 RepID=A0A3N2R993_9RHOB|nr:potassium channel family protein [Histidinibacterium lentulum]ROU03983.1 two pore domain potassium channel family protein [Histidinibacterium lentulum]